MSFKQRFAEQKLRFAKWLFNKILTKYPLFLMDKVSRLEVVDDKGRAYTSYLGKTVRYTLSLQDEGRTLKIFIDDKSTTNEQI